MRVSTFLLCFLPWTTPVLANVEKTIFIAPEAIQIPQVHPNLDDLHLNILTPNKSILRTHLPASFPRPPETRGTISWFLLDDLQQKQRHEVRVCWPATVRGKALVIVFDTFPVISNFPWHFVYWLILLNSNRQHSPLRHSHYPKYLTRPSSSSHSHPSPKAATPYPQDRNKLQGTLGQLRFFSSE